MNQQNTINPGNTVRFHYSITLEDGTVADSTFGEEPVEVTLGQGQMHQSFEFALMGMSAGEEQTIQIDPDQGFGFHEPDNVYELSRDGFPQDMQLAVGQIISLTAPNGEDLPGSITAIADDKVTVDLNHPFAGKTLSFKAKVLEILA
jgi:FKBP-type peptidyl-prolyl cis-trans isomerase SlpA